MTTATDWQGVSLRELMFRIEFCLDNYGVCHVYMIDGGWSLGSTLHNVHRDDHVMTLNRVTGADAHRAQRREITLKWFAAVKDEVLR